MMGGLVRGGGALWGLLVGEGGRREGVAVYCRWESLGSVAHKIFMVGWLVGLAGVFSYYIKLL